MTLITFLLFAVSVFLIYKGKIFKSTLVSSKLIAFVFAIKFLFIILFVSYLDKHKEFDLKGDHDYYLHDAKVLNNVFYQSPTTYFKLLSGLDNSEDTRDKYLSETRIWINPYLEYNDCRSVIRAHSIVDFIANGNPYFHLLLVNFLSVFSMLLLIKVVSKHVSATSTLFLVLSLAIPTIFIYGNLVMKEHFLIFGFSALLYGLSTKKLKSIYTWIGLLFLLSVKIYIFGILLLATMIYYSLKLVHKNVYKIGILTTYLTLLVMILFTPFGTKIVFHISKQQYDFDKVATKGLYLHDEALKSDSHYFYLNVEDTAYFKYQDDANVVLIQDLTIAKHKWLNNEFLDSIHHAKGHAFHLDMVVPKTSGSYVPPFFIHYDKVRLLKNIPSSIFYTLTQPTLNSPGSVAKYPIILETLSVLLLSFFSLGYALFYNRQKLFSAFSIAVLFFISVSAFLVGVTTPVIGAMVRYRVPTYFAIILLTFILINPIWQKKSHASREK